VVVDDVEQHHQAACVRRIDEGLQLVGRPVARRGRERQHAVVAPVARAGERGDRHQLDRRDTERGEIVESGDGRAERPFRRERADVQLVDHHLFPRATAPRRFSPVVLTGIDDRARRVNAVGIEPRRGIRNREAPVDAEDVAVARAHAADRRFEPAFAVRRQAMSERRLRASEQDFDARCRRCPQPEARAVRAHFGAERHRVTSLHLVVPRSGQPPFDLALTTALRCPTMTPQQ
jgi:hypothetical protein